MEFINLEAENFLIIGSASVKLNNRGLTIIEGVNNDDTTSESNGSGKSSIVEAIYWCLFGDTLRSLEKSDDIVNSNIGKNCRVKLSFKEGGKDYEVERFRKHSKYKNNLYLTINGVDSRGKDNKDTQRYIEDIIVVDKVTFAASIVFGQGYSKNLRRFGELTDKEQKECLEKVLDLEIFSVAHNVTKRKFAALSSDLGKLEVNCTNLANKYKSCKTNFESFKDKRDSFDSEKQEKLESIQAKISLIDSRVDGLKQELENFIGVDLEDLQKEILELGEVKSSLGLRKEKLIESYNEKKVKLTTTYNSISKHIDGLCGRKEKLASEDLHGEECFYCGGRVLERTVRKAAEGIDFEIDDNKRSLSEVETKLRKLNKAFKKRKLSMEDDVDQINQLLILKNKEVLESTKANEKKIEIKSSIKSLGDKRLLLLEKLAEEGERENPWTELVKENKEELERIKEEHKVEKEAYDAKHQELTHLEFWKKGFSRTGVRSFMLDRVIPFLNDKTNYYLGILTDGGVSVTFSATKVLGSGERRESFNVSVNNHKASQTYKGNSGGERRRIDLAIALAINDLIALRSGRSFNLVLLDEVFENVDETGSYYVIKVLEEIAKKKSSVFVITHQQSLSDYFHNRLLVERKDGQSYVN